MRFWQKAKIFFCAALAVTAILALVATLADIGALEVSAAGRDEYLLRSREGVVCVYRLPNRREPVFVSEVETGPLSPPERARLASGIGAADYAEALALLAQMGS